MENKQESKKNELDEVSAKFQEEKRKNKKLNNLAKKQNKERHVSKKKVRVVL